MDGCVLGPLRAYAGMNRWNVRPLLAFPFGDELIVSISRSGEGGWDRAWEGSQRGEIAEGVFGCLARPSACLSVNCRPGYRIGKLRVMDGICASLARAPAVAWLALPQDVHSWKGFVRRSVSVWQ